jgi:hypothetical protein
MVIERGLPYLLLCWLILTSAGCSAEKEVVREQTIEELIASIPAIELSADDLVYSRAGDLRAALPVGWVSLDALSFGIPELFVVACDADYSMTLLFSEIPIDRELGRSYQDGGMPALVKAHFEDRKDRAIPEVLEFVGGEFTIGRRRFYGYLYTQDKGVTYTRVALFTTGRNLYECTITHLPYSESDLPSLERFQEIHQIILSGITW